MGLSLFLVFSLLLSIGSSIRVAPQSSCHRNVKGAHHRNSSSIHLPLHHPRSPCSPAPLPELTVSDMLRHDDVRVAALASRLTKSGTALSSNAVSVPLNPGAVFHTGNYVTIIGLGTPSVNYAMEVDTGSSFSWLQCAPCRVSCHPQAGTIFNPNSSTSYSTVPCSAAECGELPTATGNPSLCTLSGNVCGYQATYGDNSSSVGYLSKETLTLGSGSSSMLPGFIFGCGQANDGGPGNLFGQTAGLIGLDTDKLSLVSQVSPSLGSSFAYCLSSPTSTGYLSIGQYDSSNVAFTPMLPNSPSTLYYLQLSSITIAGTTLPVSASSYTALPTVVDSGTVVTHLPSDVYTTMSKAIVAALANVTPAPAFSILDTCFEGSLTSLPVLEVKVAFGAGVELSLPMENVFIDVPNSTCLAFRAETLGVNIIGNRLQQSFRVVFDVGASKIGFGPSEC